jgi:hypothetical protein
LATIGCLFSDGHPLVGWPALKAWLQLVVPATLGLLAPLRLADVLTKKAPLALSSREHLKVPFAATSGVCFWCSCGDVPLLCCGCVRRLERLCCAVLCCAVAARCAWGA